MTNRNIAEGCLDVCPDLDLLSLANSFGVDLPRDKYPRKSWWKFWEGNRTREEYIEDEHMRYIEERKCHIWNGRPFHSCGIEILWE